MRLLIVEDHTELREAVARRCRALGHAVDEAATSRAAEALLDGARYDVLILDRMLGSEDALDSLGRWRAAGQDLPTLILTAHDEVHDRVAGFEAGADDHLGKPFAMAELLARVQALGRRSHEPKPARLRVDDLELDSGRREVRRAGILLPLRPKEYAVLEVLMRRRGRVVSRGELREACWDEVALSNVEEAAIASVRRKLGAPALIQTRRGQGWIIEDGHEG